MISPTPISERVTPEVYADIPEEPPFPDRLRLIKLGLLTLVALALCVLLAIPYLPALTWGMALAIIGWPLHRWMNEHVSTRAWSAVITCLVVITLVLGSGAFVTYEMAREASSQVDRMQEQSAEGTVKDTLSRSGLGVVVSWMDRAHVDIDVELRKVFASYTQDLSSLVEGSVMAILQFVVAVFIMFHFLKDRGAVLGGVRVLLPLARAESDRVFKSVLDSVHANLYATLVTSLIDAVGGGILFWLLGLPSPVTWGVVMFILSVLPILGTFLVWGPAAFYLAIVGHWPGALILVGWGVLSWFVNDNFVYVRIAGGHMRMHQVPALIAFLGGLAVFGVSGMIIGPAIAACTLAILDLWRTRSAEAGGEPKPAEVNGMAQPVTT
jgi:predicted PurR-regulated permease PerM